ncbi:MAG: Crp/Fnr family transcriptional regulator [Clostridia bacterium]|nr:Crp/Fnr family transcriptional regulator [Clostridia bacterium]
MEINPASLANLAPFAGIGEEDTDRILRCLSPRRALYGKGEYIMRGGETPDKLGMIVSGSALLFSDDRRGNRNLILLARAGSTLGWPCAALPGAPEINAAANEDSVVLWIAAEKLGCSAFAQCRSHGAFLLNLLSCASARERALTEKISHMGRRTTRQKLLAYLASQAAEHGCAEFDIPFSRQQLADYLFVDRSAMSAELSALRREGIIQCDRSHFKLLR